MTPEQIAIALALRGATYGVGTFDKRFARDMAWQAQNDPEKALTDKQASYLAWMHHKYRRQVVHTCTPECEHLRLMHSRARDEYARELEQLAKWNEMSKDNDGK